MEAKWAQTMSAIDMLKAENRTLKGLCATLLERVQRLEKAVEE